MRAPAPTSGGLCSILPFFSAWRKSLCPAENETGTTPAVTCTPDLLSDTDALFLQLGPAASDTLLDGLDLEHQLRGFLLKLQFADAWMKPLPQGLPAGYLLSAGLVMYSRPCHTSSVHS